MKPPSPLRFALLVVIGFFIVFFLIDNWYHPIQYTIGSGVFPEKIKPNSGTDE